MLSRGGTCNRNFGVKLQYRGILRWERCHITTVKLIFAGYSKEIFRSFSKNCTEQSIIQNFEKHVYSKTSDSHSKCQSKGRPAATRMRPCVTDLKPGELSRIRLLIFKSFSSNKQNKNKFTELLTEFYLEKIWVTVRNRPIPRLLLAMEILRPYLNFSIFLLPD